MINAVVIVSKTDVKTSTIRQLVSLGFESLCPTLPGIDPNSNDLVVTQCGSNAFAVIYDVDNMNGETLSMVVADDCNRNNAAVETAMKLASGNIDDMITTPGRGAHTAIGTMDNMKHRSWAERLVNMIRTWKEYIAMSARSVDEDRGFVITLGVDVNTAGLEEQGYKLLRPIKHNISVWAKDQPNAVVDIFASREFIGFHSPEISPAAKVYMNKLGIRGIDQKQYIMCQDTGLFHHSRVSRTIGLNIIGMR